MWRKEFVYKSFLVIVQLSLFVSYVKKWKLSNKKYKLLCTCIVCVCLSNYVSLFLLVHLFANLGENSANYCVHVLCTFEKFCLFVLLVRLFANLGPGIFAQCVQQ